MVTMYLINNLHKNLTCSKYIFSVTIISKLLNVNNNHWIHMKYGHSYIFKVYICKSQYTQLSPLEYTKYTFVYS